MSKKYWHISFFRLALLLLPTFLRGDTVAAFVRALVTPVQRLHVSFTDFRIDTDYKLSHSSQVCYLEKVLNDAFDSVLRRITVTDLQRYGGTYLCLNTELKPAYLGKLSAVTAEELADSGFDFAVNLNGAALQPGDEARMRSVIDYYKLASKRYRIK